MPLLRKDDFATDGHWHSVVSSNVEMARYDAAEQTLSIRYLDGKTAAYDPISPTQAKSFIQASSAGGWLWDNVRIRGTKHGHQCNFRYV